MKGNHGNVEGRLKQNENQHRHIDDTTDGFHKTVTFPVIFPEDTMWRQ